MKEARVHHRQEFVAAAGILIAVCVGVAVLVFAGGSGPGNTSVGFPDAPHTQRNGYGVATDACPLAPANRYLPARSGCVTVIRADVNGDGRPDLILVYSRVSRQHPDWFAGGTPPSLQHDFVAQAAFLKVVLANGTSVTARIPPARAASIVAVAHVGDERGDELFIQFLQISSGANAVAYGLHAGRLVAAGVTLAYGGDSASKAGFDCLTGNPARLLQRTFELLGATIYAWWRQTDVTYAWHGPLLVKIAVRTFERRGLPPANETDVGAGCTTGIG